jgi:hypothetical protein
MDSVTDVTQPENEEEVVDNEGFDGLEDDLPEPVEEVKVERVIPPPPGLGLSAAPGMGDLAAKEAEAKDQEEYIMVYAVAEGCKLGRRPRIRNGDYDKKLKEIIDVAHKRRGELGFGIGVSRKYTQDRILKEMKSRFKGKKGDPAPKPVAKGRPVGVGKREGGLDYDCLAGRDMAFLAQTDAEYLDSCGGYTRLIGGTEGWQKAIDFLKKMKSVRQQLRCGVACSIILEKPTRLVMTGVTKTMAEAGAQPKDKLDERLAWYIPKMTAEEWSEMDPAHKRKREAWQPAFQRMNKSLTVRVALLYMEYASENALMVKDWRVLHGGRPSVSMGLLSGSDKTKEVKMDSLNKFKRSLEYIQAQSPGDLFPD